VERCLTPGVVAIPHSMIETVVDSGAHRKRVGLKIIGGESCWAVGSHWNGEEKSGGRASSEGLIPES
jgi:chemotaxis receptor (MCP) glutamine deamidase CheD